MTQHLCGVRITARASPPCCVVVKYLTINTDGHIASWDEGCTLCSFSRGLRSSGGSRLRCYSWKKWYRWVAGQCFVVSREEAITLWLDMLALFGWERFGRTVLLSVFRKYFCVNKISVFHCRGGGGLEHLVTEMWGRTASTLWWTFPSSRRFPLSLSSSACTSI